MSQFERTCRRASLGAVGMLCLLSLTACGSSSDGATASPRETSEIEASEPDPIAVRTEPLLRKTLSELYATTATLRADKQATVTARTSGVVEALLVEEGDTVAAGTALAILEHDEQRIAFERAGNILQNVKREFERSAKLHEQGLVSDEAFETTRRTSVEAEHASELAALELSRTTIVAPFSGRVLVRHIDVGATVSSGSAVYDLADLIPLYADINVPERHVDRLAVDQVVRLFADSFDLEVTARIERIAPRVDTDTGTIKVTLAVNGQPKLRPGTFVRAAVVTDTHEGALVVRRSALIPEGRRWHLFRLTQDGSRVKRLEVRRGFEEGAYVEVSCVDSEARLTPGDAIVTVGAAALTDGVLVDAGSPDSDGSGRDAS